MEQDYESFQDVEKQEILPSFEPKAPLRSLMFQLMNAVIHVGFVLSIVVVLAAGDWVYAILLLLLYVLYMSV